MDLSILNPRQLEAVLHTEGPLLILAGAGSGKTRTITYRIAYLLQEKKVYAENILALTFTNKAAREMKQRVERLVGIEEDLWISTFHSCCAKILRKDIDRIGYSRSFTIYDDSDQQSLIADCLKENELEDDSGITKRFAQSMISEAKNKHKDPEEYFRERGKYDLKARKLLPVYRAYQENLRRNNALDFDDLLLCTLALFAAAPDILEAYQQRFHYVHVDEYQDTNLAQYTFVRLISQKHGNICVVGDDDQGIYSWRGADIRNILEFEKDFPDTYTVYLEQNYRSSQYILDAANSVIANNTSRKPKKLWTSLGKGDKPKIQDAQDEHGEAKFICESVAEYCSKGYACSDIAVLYRMNAQSRVIEEMLRYYNIPYKVYGGVGFYQRKEVKDVIAYLRLIENPADDVSLKRVINSPKRGIGQSTVAAVEEASRKFGRSMFAVLLDAEQYMTEPRILKKLHDFSELMKKLLVMKNVLPLGQFTEEMLMESGYLAQYENAKDEESTVRAENVKEFLSAIYEFENEGGTLAQFLENITLVADIDSLVEDDNGAVSLMTLHSAKGLEFPVVFISGMEEGIFPHARAFINPEDLEEERRLCYVGMTRAKRQLAMIYCRTRNLMGKFTHAIPSRFLKEIPLDLVEGTIKNVPNASLLHETFPYPKPVKSTVKEIGKMYTPLMIQRDDADKYAEGAKVKHPKFGVGTIVYTEGSGSGKTITVNFEQQGERKLALAFAKMEIIE
ncbi:MAG: ATP-dependent helicase [Christensenellales bacterium]